MTAVTTRAYRRGELTLGAELRGVSELLGGRYDVVWVDVTEPADSDLRWLAGELRLHPLAVEDALVAQQRDKYVDYGDHAFLVAHALGEHAGPADLEFVELHVFVGTGWLLTVRRGGDEALNRMLARWDTVRQLAGDHFGLALYAILWTVVHGYLGAIDRFEQFYDDAAERIFGGDVPEEHHRQKFETRKSLDHFARIVTSLSEAVARLVDDADRFASDAMPYLTDVEGDLGAVRTEVEGLGALVTQLLDADILLRDHRQNVGMKKVTSWAAIIAVPTLVTGYYGMNVPFPGEGQVSGVITSSLVAGICSLALYVVFRIRRWL